MGERRKQLITVDQFLEWHIPMERFHGGEYQCKYAEAFVKQVWNPTTTQK